MEKRKTNHPVFFYKNITVAALVLFVFLSGIASCSDSVLEKEERITFENPAFNVNEDATTYTSLDDKLKVLWQEGDKIGIFCTQTEPEAINERAVLHQAYIGQNRGVFRSDINWGSDRHKFYVYYPWKKEAGTSASTLKHTIGQVQTQKGNNSMHIGKNAFMYARSNEVVPASGDIALDFTHTTCIFEISFKSDFPEVFGKPLTKVVLKNDNGAVLTGDFTMDITKMYHLTSNPPKFATIASGNASDSVIVNLQDAYMPDNTTDSLRVYLVVNPAYMNNAIIKYTVDGQEYSLTKSVARQLKAQSVYKIMTKVDYGVASISPAVIYLSATNPTQTVMVNSTHNWILDGMCDVATTSCIEGERGESSITFTRKTSSTDFTVYGNSTVRIKTIGENPKYSSVRVSNIHLDVPEILNIGNPKGPDTTFFIPDIIPFGGDAKYVVDSYTGDWIQSMVYDEISGKMRAKVLRNNTETDRPGSVTVYHVNDPEHKIVVPLLQNEFVYIPEFKYFVLDVKWCSGPGMDVDIALMFENNKFIGDDGNAAYPPFEHLPVGWSNLYADPSLVNQPANYAAYYSGSHGSNATGLIVKYMRKHDNSAVDLMYWGGDAVSGEGETVYFDAELFHNSTDVPRYLTLGLYLTWYNHGISEESYAVRTELNCFKGGSMLKYSSNGNRKVNYQNTGGVSVHSQKFFMNLNHPKGSPGTFTKTYTYVAKITYDRLTHYGIMREPSPGLWDISCPECPLCTTTGTDIYTRRAPLTKEELERIGKAKDKAVSQLFK